jgi:hypothetical protein
MFYAISDASNKAEWEAGLPSTRILPGSKPLSARSFFET